MDLYEVATGGDWRLAVTKRPRGGDWLGDEMLSLARAGVTHLVSALTLSEERELDLVQEAAEATAAGIAFVAVPILDFGFPGQGTAPILRPLAGKPGTFTAVHCRQGLGRSPMLAAGLLVLAGIPGEDAWTRVQAARGVPVPETAEQRAWAVSLGSSALR